MPTSITPPPMSVALSILGDKGSSALIDDSVETTCLTKRGFKHPLASALSLFADTYLYCGGKMSDEMFTYETPLSGWLLSLQDPQEFHDFTYLKLTVSIYEYLLYQVSESDKHDANALCSESMLVTAATVKYLIRQIADTIINGDVATASWGRLLSDIIAYSESVANNLSMTAIQSENLDATDLITWAWFLQASDTLVTTDAVNLIPLMYALASNSISVETNISETCRISFALAETNELSERVASSGIFGNILTDSVGFIIRITIDGEIYQCWVLNTNELYPSCYSNFSFNSYAVLDGTSYAANESGIYKLIGTTDNGTAIETGLRLNIFNTGIQKGKRFDNARFGISGTNLAIKVTTENDSIQYYILNGRCKIARGQHGREWVFELAKAEHIDFIELYQAILSR